MTNNDRWLTTTEIAEHLRKPESWIYNNAERLKIPRHRLGQQYRFKVSEVDLWLAGRDSDGR